MEKYLPVVAIGLLCLTVITITLTMIIEIWMGKASDKNEYRFEIRQEMYEDFRKNILKHIIHDNVHQVYGNDQYYQQGHKDAMLDLLKYVDKLADDETRRHVRKNNAE